MSGILSLAIVLIAFAMVIKKVKDTQGPETKKPGSGRTVMQGAQKAARPRGYTNYRPHKDIVSVSRDMGDKNSSVLRDDKNNDWLARQLREEHRAFKATSEMFDLKIEHASHCDARLIEQFHRRHCDARGVDTGTGR